MASTSDERARRNCIHSPCEAPLDASHDNGAAATERASQDVPVTPAGADRLAWRDREASGAPPSAVVVPVVPERGVGIIQPDARPEVIVVVVALRLSRGRPGPAVDARPAHREHAATDGVVLV